VRARVQYFLLPYFFCHLVKILYSGLTFLRVAAIFANLPAASLSLSLSLALSLSLHINIQKRPKKFAAIFAQLPAASKCVQKQ
jgi:hypothetical protein